MMRFLICDIKRIFESKGMAALCVLAPVVVMLLFSSIVAPLLFTAEVTKFNIAILNEDENRPVRQFIDQLVNSQALKDLVVAYPADSLQGGEAMLRAGEVLVLIHVPDGFFESMRDQGNTQVDLYSLSGHQLEVSLIRMTLESSLATVGKSQNLIEATRTMVMEKGVSRVQGDAFVEDTTDFAIASFMNRRQVLGQKGNVSPLGEFLPTEYYLGAVFALFAAMAMIPIVRLTALDLAGTVRARGMLVGKGAVHFYSARLLSGTLLITLVLLMVFPTGIITEWLNLAMKITFSQNTWALAAATGLTAICFCALGILLGTWIPDEEAALWTVFYVILGMALLSGALLPEGYLPEPLRDLGRFLPMRSSMRAMVSSLFRYNEALYFQDMMKLGLWTAGLVTAGLGSFILRGRRI